jgi:subtilisin family serine protease
MDRHGTFVEGIAAEFHYGVAPKANIISVNIAFYNRFLTSTESNAQGKEKLDLPS